MAPPKKTKKPKLKKPKKTKAKLKATAPGQNGDVELVRVALPDPMEPLKEITVTKNIRVHPLDAMKARGKISQSQFAAGETFLELYERAQIGDLRAIDYEKVKVDVSYVHRGLADHVAVAQTRLNEIRGKVGELAYERLEKIVGQRITPMQLWQMEGAEDRDRGLWHIYQCLREYLDEVAKYLNVARGPDSGRIRSAHGENLGRSNPAEIQGSGRAA